MSLATGVKGIDCFHDYRGSFGIQNATLHAAAGTSDATYPVTIAVAGGVYFDTRGSSAGAHSLHLHLHDGSAWFTVPKLSYAETVSGQWTFDTGVAQPPFILGANNQGQLVTGLNADKLDNYHASTSVIANNVVVRDAGGDVPVNAVPSTATSAASKQYVDNAVVGIQVKGAANAYLGSALPAYTQTSATILTANANGAFPTVDGVAAVLNNVYIVNGETGGGAADNGIWKLTQVGDGGNPWILHRTADADTWAKLVEAYCLALSGTLYAGAGFLCNVVAGGTLGTTAVGFNQFTAASAWSAGNGIDITGTVISVKLSGGTTYSTGGIVYCSSSTALAYAAFNGLVLASDSGPPTAITTSAGMLGVISDHTGSGGGLVFATAPTLTTLTIGSGSIVMTGAQSLTTTTGNLTLGSSGGNGNVVLSPNGTGYVSVTTDLIVSGAIEGVTAGHFKGWTFSSCTGLGLDVGVSGGIGQVITYNRTSNAYASTEIIADNTYLKVKSNADGNGVAIYNQAGGLLTVDNQAGGGTNGVQVTYNGAQGVLLGSGVPAVSNPFVWALSGLSLDLGANGAAKWTILTTGILQSVGAQTIQTSTGALTLATGAANGNVVLSPNGTGKVLIGTSSLTTSSLLALSGSAPEVSCGASGSDFAVFGQRYSVQSAFVATNARQTDCTSDSWTQPAGADHSFAVFFDPAVGGTGITFRHAAPSTSPAVYATFWTELWRITPTGILQSNGAQTIQTSTGNLVLNPSGTVSIGCSATALNGAVVLGTDTFVGPVGSAGRIRLGTNSAQAFLAGNQYYYGGLKYAQTGGAGYINVDISTAGTAGDISFYSAPSGTADAAQTATETWRIKQGGTLQATGAQTIQTSTGILTLVSDTYVKVTSILSADTGFRIANAAAAGHYLRGNGTNYVDSALLAGDISGTVAISAGGTGQTTASTAFNALSPMTTAGDIIYGGTLGAGTRLGLGTTGYFLTAGASAPQWSNALPSSVTITGLTQGSVLFGGAAGAVLQDNAKLFWDDTNHCLAIGGNTQIGASILSLYGLAETNISTATAQMQAGDAGIILATTNTAVSNLTHRCSPWFSQTAAIWTGASTPKSISQQVVGIGGVNSKYAWNISSTDISGIVFVRGDSGTVIMGGGGGIFSDLGSGILQLYGGLTFSGAQTIQTTTGTLSLTSGGANGNVTLTPNGTGLVNVVTNTVGTSFAGLVVKDATDRVHLGYVSAGLPVTNLVACQILWGSPGGGSGNELDGTLLISSSGNQSSGIVFYTNSATTATERWRITCTGMLQAPGAAFIQTATGSLWIGAGGSGDINLTAGGIVKMSAGATVGGILASRVYGPHQLTGGAQTENVAHGLGVKVVGFSILDYTNGDYIDADVTRVDDNTIQIRLPAGASIPTASGSNGWWVSCFA